jgi:L-alanine-DL-glutamate epimerase-like enolase superfamily enzyme
VPEPTGTGEIALKITSHEVIVVNVPMEAALMGRTESPHTILRLRTDDGIEGIGWAFMFGAMGPALAKALDGVAELLHGEDPMLREHIDGIVDAATSGSGPGMSHYVRAVINFAVWDITGKAQIGRAHV